MYNQATVTATGQSIVCVIRWIKNCSLGSTERHANVLERYPVRVCVFCHKVVRFPQFYSLFLLNFIVLLSAIVCLAFEK